MSKLREDGRFSTVIRVDLREVFANHPNKGKLVNDLLESYFGQQDAPYKNETTDIFKKLQDTYDTRKSDPSWNKNTNPYREEPRVEPME